MNSKTLRMFLSTCLLLASCTYDKGARVQTPQEPAAAPPQSVQSARSVDDCPTVIRFVDDLEITTKGRTLELDVRFDSKGKSETIPLYMQEPIKEACLSYVWSRAGRPSIHFYVAQDAPIGGRFYRGTWVFRGPVGNEKTLDGRRILVLPLSRFRFSDYFPATVAP